MKSAVVQALSRSLLSDLRRLIADAKNDVARQVNSDLVLLYWHIGQRVRQDILKEKGAGYEIVPCDRTFTRRSG
jgi:hypothetical protein